MKFEVKTNSLFTCAVCGCHNSGFMIRCEYCRKLYCICAGGQNSCFTNHIRRTTPPPYIQHGSLMWSLNGKSIDESYNLVFECPSYKIRMWNKKFRCPMNWLLKSNHLYSVVIPSWVNNKEK